jgi:serine/threonine protein kinase
MAIEESLDVVEQIAEGLEAAHENGILHRDLKPSNVKITPEGKAKILDFGLAKALDGEGRAQDLERSPTITARNLTEAGVVFGTIPYMSPEQARGRPVDRRSDIWALGCVLYECLAGRRAFEGDTASDTIVEILERNPDWDALPKRTPPRVRELLERCLEKDLRRRVRDAGDVRIELERAREAREWTTSGPLRAGLTAREQRGRRTVPWTIAGLSSAVAIVAIVVAALAVARASRSSSSDRHRSPVALRVDVTDPDIPRAPSTDNATIAISPDGTTVAYLGRTPGASLFDSTFYVRTADAVNASVLIEHLTTSFGVYDAFFSPDGKWIGFRRKGSTRSRFPGAARSCSPRT